MSGELEVRVIANYVTPKPFNKLYTNSARVPEVLAGERARSWIRRLATTSRSPCTDNAVGAIVRAGRG